MKPIQQRRLLFPTMTSSEAVLRAQRHVKNSITTLRHHLARMGYRWHWPLDLMGKHRWCGLMNGSNTASCA